ncbi:hypothetical protein FI667_g15819, partial [Globisporangium splendens]
MALPSRKNWDLTHLATKYPWLRVDSETIEEFRSPFQWVDAPATRKQQKPSIQCGRGHAQQRGVNSKEEEDDDDEDGGSSSDSGESDNERFSLSGRQATETTSISTRLQHRMLCVAFERWRVFLLGLRKEDRKQAAFQRSQVQALALFDKLASDAYIGTLDRALHRWHQITCEVVYKERQHAATVIQVRYRQRRAKALLAGLKQVALDKEFKQKVEIQQLLKFEAYGTAMHWSTLRNGFNLLLQNICARRIQFFFRRIMLQRRIERRIVRKHAAIRIQCPWCRKLARKELARRKELFRTRQELEAHSATVIQHRVRGFLAKAALAKKRAWQSNKNQRALDIQCCWRKHRQRVELYRRFEVRRHILDVEIARLAQLRHEAMREAAARDIQRVFHGFQGRKAYRAKVWERTLDLARIFRGRRHRKQYQRTRRATITIQGDMKTKLAHRERQRRLDRRLEEIRQCNEASVRIQTWVRAREELLTQNAALLIQKRTRGMEARKVTLLLRQAMQLVELEQSRQYRDSSRESSPLLQFMTEHYLHSGGGEDVVRHFTNAQCLWLEDHIRAAQAQIAKEDHAIVFLQRMYRCFVTRVDYVVMAPASRLASKTTDQDPCTEEMKQESLTNAASADNDASSTSPSLERHSVNRKRRTRQRDTGGNESR